MKPINLGNKDSIFDLRDSLAKTIRIKPSDIVSEKRIHDAVSNALCTLKYEFFHEHQLSAHHRLDFLVAGRHAIEVKKGRVGIGDLPQIGWYLEYATVGGCLVIARQCSGLPAMFLNKPIVVLELWKFLL